MADIPLDGSRSPLKLRGTAGTLPFWLGTTMYNGMWKGFELSDQREDWWWFDKAHWQRLFSKYQQSGLNAIVYWHPHPYVGFIECSRYPEARYYDSAQMARRIEMFRWITAEGKKYGVSIYLYTWNICMPQGMVSAHKIQEFGEDTALTRDYTRYAVAEIFRTYPDFGGLFTQAAESPPGCTEFISKAILPGMMDSVKAGSERKTLPMLLYWMWCTYPEDAKKILDAYPGPKMALHYLQYECLFRPMADPRIKMTSDALGGTKMVALGGPVGIFYWGDPWFVQKILQDLVRKNGAGILFQSLDYMDGYAERWIAREAYERYASNPYQIDSDSYWQARIADRYGSQQIAAPLLKAMINSTNVMPRFTHLIHSQTDHFHPHMGMPLVNMLEMPTISTYVFENHESIDAKGRLKPNMGLSWPNPYWGEDVMSIKQFVQDRKPPRWMSKRGKVTSPVEIAEEMNRLCQSALECIQTVRAHASQVSQRRQELDNSLVMMELNCRLGLHYVARIRAAIAWERWRYGKAGASSAEVLQQLDASIHQWKLMSVLSLKPFPDPINGWQSQVCVEPPWTHTDIWNGYANVTMKLEQMLPVFLRERVKIASEMTKPRKIARLPLFPELTLPEGDMEMVAAADFRSGMPRFLAASDSKSVLVRLCNDANMRIGDGSSLLCDSRVGQEEWNMVLTSVPSQLALQRGKVYMVDFDYRVIDAGRFGLPFAVAARSVEGGVPSDIGSYRQWGGAVGKVGHKRVMIDPKRYDDYYLFISIHGQAAIVIDNLQIRCVRN